MESNSVCNHIRVIAKSDDRAAGVRFVYHENDYRPKDDTKSHYQLITKIAISEKRIAKLRKKGKICIERLKKEAQIDVVIA